jgi:integrase
VPAIKLTDPVVKRYRPDPSRRIELPDAGKPGLYLVIQPTGARSWAYRYRFGGQPRKLTIGAYPKVTLAMAHDAADKANDEVLHGRDPSARKRGGASADDTLATQIELYRQRHVASLRESTRAYIIPILKRMQDEWPGRVLHSINKSDVVRFIDKALTKRGPSASVLHWKVCKAFFAWVEAREDDFASPARSIKKPAKEKSRDRVLDDDELSAVWQAADVTGGSAGALTKLLILTGCRRGEITHLEWQEITERAIELPSERTKNAHPHMIPLTDTMRRVLAALPKTGNYALNGSDRPMGDHSGGKEKIRTRIRHWTFHDLRRSFASGLQRLGVAPHIVELCLNHRSGTFRGVAGIYQRHRYTKEVKEAFELWSEHIEALTTAKARAA